MEQLEPEEPEEPQESGEKQAQAEPMAGAEEVAQDEQTEKEQEVPVEQVVLDEQVVEVRDAPFSHGSQVQELVDEKLNGLDTGYGQKAACQIHLRRRHSR